MTPKEYDEGMNAAIRIGLIGLLLMGLTTIGLIFYGVML